MKNIDEELKNFISTYSQINHDKFKLQANVLLKKHPNKIQLFKIVSMLYLQNNKFSDAIEVMKELLNILPKDIDTLINTGVAYYQLDKFNRSIEFLEKAKKLGIKKQQVYYNLGKVYQKKNHIDEAIKYFKLSLKFDSKDIDTLLNLGNIYLTYSNTSKAKKIYEDLVKIKSNDPNIYHDLGIIFTKLGKIDQAIQNYLNAEKLNSTNPLTYYNLGTLYNSKFSFKKSKLYYKKSIELNPNSYNSYYNLAWVQTLVKEYDSAIENYKKAINVFPEFPQANFKLSLIYLAKENFSEGWDLNEFRTKIKEANVNQKKILNLNLWNGKKFNGSLFVHGEQGVGDQILHSSIINDLYQRHKKISLFVDHRLVSLFERSFKKIKIIGTNINQFNSNDRHILLGSLGRFFRRSINDFKKEHKPYIIPDPQKVNQFKKIFSKNKCIKVGISWNSIGLKNKEKNISLNQLSKILTLDNFEFINLQYGNTSKERKLFEKKFNVKITNYEDLDLTNDFESQAALIKSCDLIITISNTIAHLAGSLGTPTYLLLSKFPLWWWFTNRSNSLWYNNVKLFRQSKDGEWKDVVNNIYKKLSKLKSMK